LPEFVVVRRTSAFGVTVTFVDALFPAPAAFDGVTVKVVDCVTATTCEPWLVDATKPLTGGDADQAKAVGAPPPAQDAVRVTLPPPTGTDEDDGLTVQPDGGKGAKTLTIVDALFPAPEALEGVTVKVVVCVTVTLCEP